MKTVTAEQWADTLVNRLFANRTGHGATPGVTYMQMRPPALRDVARESFVAGAQFANSTLVSILTEDNNKLRAILANAVRCAERDALGTAAPKWTVEARAVLKP